MLLIDYSDVIVISASLFDRKKYGMENSVKDCIIGQEKFNRYRNNQLTGMLSIDCSDIIIRPASPFHRNKCVMKNSMKDCISQEKFNI